jgi:hypothetical protein
MRRCITSPAASHGPGRIMGCPRHTAALQAAHPGSSVVDAQDAIGTMQVFGTHPGLVDLDDEADTRYGRDH